MLDNINLQRKQASIYVEQKKDKVQLFMVALSFFLETTLLFATFSVVINAYFIVRETITAFVLTVFMIFWLFFKIIGMNKTINQRIWLQNNVP